MLLLLSHIREHFVVDDTKDAEQWPYRCRHGGSCLADFREFVFETV
jgi:hypothetical protein